MQAQSNVAESCPRPSTGDRHKAKAGREEALLCRAPAESSGRCPGPWLLADWFLRPHVHEQNKNSRQKIVSNGYKTTHLLSGAKSKSCSGKIQYMETVVTEGWQPSLSPLCTFPPPQVALFTPPGCPETKPWDVNKECWYRNWSVYHGQERWLESWVSSHCAVIWCCWMYLSMAGSRCQ